MALKGKPISKASNDLQGYKGCEDIELSGSRVRRAV